MSDRPKPPRPERHSDLIASGLMGTAMSNADFDKLLKYTRQKYGMTL